MRTARAAGVVLLTTVVAATLGGCTAIVPLEPADDANNPGCADVIVRLPDTVADQPRRETNAQGTGAWGSPTSVLLYCGVEVPSASTFTCVEVDGVFWLRNDDNADSGTFTFRLYGREPAIDVVVDTDLVGTFPALSDLGRAVAYTRPNGHECVGIEDATPAPSPTPAPSDAG
jgi:hypothetical protein